MSRVMKIIAVCALMLSSLGAGAQGDGYEIFVPIGRYLGAGDAEKLSAWFADNLEISVMSRTSDSSRAQARQILKTFFESYTPRSFVIRHRASQAQSKYAVGDLVAGGEHFQVTIFVTLSRGTYRIQQLKIDMVR